jgi:imidazolonepropionase-like amidohydrolase
VANEDEIVVVINSLAEKGVDGIKLYSELPLHVFSRGVHRAHEIGLPVSAHVGHSRRVTVKQAVEAGVDAIEHTATFLPDMFPPDELAETMRNAYTIKNQLRGFIAWSKVDLQKPRVSRIISLLAEKRVYHTPTLINIENLINGERSIGDNEQLLLKQIPEEIKVNWRQQTPSLFEEWSDEERKIATQGFEKIKHLVGLLYREGVRLGVGSDAPNPWTIPGAALIREMELMVECGIPPMKVIQLATKNAAVALGKRFEDVGSIKEGNSADLIILKENPAIDISNCRKIAYVIRRGLLHNPAEFE